MTTWEARIVLGLKPEDTPTEEGLLVVRKSAEEIMARTGSKIEQGKCKKTIKAVDKLLSCHKQYNSWGEDA